MFRGFLTSVSVALVLATAQATDISKVVASLRSAEEHLGPASGLARIRTDWAYLRIEKGILVPPEEPIVNDPWGDFDFEAYGGRLRWSHLYVQKPARGWGSAVRLVNLITPQGLLSYTVYDRASTHGFAELNDPDRLHLSPFLGRLYRGKLLSEVVADLDEVTVSAKGGDVLVTGKNARDEDVSLDFDPREGWLAVNGSFRTTRSGDDWEILKSVKIGESWFATRGTYSEGLGREVLGSEATGRAVSGTPRQTYTLVVSNLAGKPANPADFPRPDPGTLVAGAGGEPLELLGDGSIVPAPTPEPPNVYPRMFVTALLVLSLPIGYLVWQRLKEWRAGNLKR